MSLLETLPDSASTKPSLLPDPATPLAKAVQRASLYTHGCRLNQAETELLRQQLQRRGYSIVPFDKPTDLAIINTCTVTREAESKCRQSIRKLLRHSPQAFVAVIGCYSQTGADALAAIEGVDLIIGNNEKLRVLDYVGYGKNKPPVILRERIHKEDFSIDFVGDLPTDQRANLKVQDGCDFGCAFCIIPRARGRARSRDFNNLLAEARTLTANGVQEIILTGVNIGTYSSSGYDFLKLVDALDAIDGLHRIRISSIEPTTTPTQLLDRMNNPAHALLPYLHLPLQSGSDAVLQRMHRRYTIQEYVDFIAKAQRHVPDLCLGTDIMVGHPGETETDFQQSCRIFCEQPFAYCHVFSYSERPGTPSARRNDSVPSNERQRRSAYLRRLSARKRHAFNTRFLGQTLEVLFERHHGEGLYSGYTSNFIRIHCHSTESNLINQRLPVKLECLDGESVKGSIRSY